MKWTLDLLGAMLCRSRQCSRNLDKPLCRRIRPAACLALCTAALHEAQLLVTVPGKPDLSNPPCSGSNAKCLGNNYTAQAKLTNTSTLLYIAAAKKQSAPLPSDWLSAQGM